MKWTGLLEVIKKRQQNSDELLHLFLKWGIPLLNKKRFKISHLFSLASWKIATEMLMLSFNSTIYVKITSYPAQWRGPNAAGKMRVCDKDVIFLLRKSEIEMREPWSIYAKSRIKFEWAHNYWKENTTESAIFHSILITLFYLPLKLVLVFPFHFSSDKQTHNLLTLTHCIFKN